MRPPWYDTEFEAHWRYATTILSLSAPEAHQFAEQMMDSGPHDDPRSAADSLAFDLGYEPHENTVARIQVNADCLPAVPAHILAEFYEDVNALLEAHS
jgi:hypothetical protein